MNGRRDHRAAGTSGGVPRWLLAAGLAAALATGTCAAPRFTTPPTKEAADGEAADGAGVGAGRGERETGTAPEPGGRSAGPTAPSPQRQVRPAPAADAAWPVAGGARGRPVVVRGFEPPASPYGPGHRGVDLRAGAGQPVRAAAAGRVAFAGRVAGRGVLAVEHPGTGRPPLRTTYEPVVPAVREGARVAAGQVVGYLQGGAYHCATACLHWGLRRGPSYLDPLSLLPPRLLTAGHARLLPVFGVPPTAGDGGAAGGGG
ncbi:peptidoglycan DD-metalloendopeptidase family protein [Streptomyces sp. WMMC500]|uniref:peptidoglycan DD-metalloendopeptidase family protein n=1 Tax=Streptomyces sp. WMMC500 TaxID=3015154 RepID=UPI00248CBC84|nr:peptidoglycan DD-metalloendopeptidase family protein [Streptomyces sp. WMMC500]WBB62778.1 peptidoglycan DD-metalloendopeptidase family protein [Streptomyces sp. WMMC500]